MSDLNKLHATKSVSSEKYNTKIAQNLHALLKLSVL
jgi:hypothetical protein